MTQTLDSPAQSPVQRAERWLTGFEEALRGRDVARGVPAGVHVCDLGGHAVTGHAVGRPQQELENVLGRDLGPHRLRGQGVLADAHACAADLLPEVGAAAQRGQEVGQRQHQGVGGKRLVEGLGGLVDVPLQVGRGEGGEELPVPLGFTLGAATGRCFLLPPFLFADRGELGVEVCGLLLQFLAGEGCGLGHRGLLSVRPRGRGRRG